VHVSRQHVEVEIRAEGTGSSVAEGPAQLGAGAQLLLPTKIGRAKAGARACRFVKRDPRDASTSSTNATATALQNAEIVPQTACNPEFRSDEEGCLPRKRERRRRQRSPLRDGQKKKKHRCPSVEMTDLLVVTPVNHCNAPRWKQISHCDYNRFMAKERLPRPSCRVVISGLASCATAFASSQGRIRRARARHRKPQK